MTPPSGPAGAAPPDAQFASGAWRRQNIAIGNFFFKYRNAVFPAVFALMVLLMRPKIILGSFSLDRFLLNLGTLIALGGELVRLTTIGFDYIDRGGKNKQVYASRLVHGGVYALTRNPMYVGNAMIAIGMTMVAGAPLGYLLIIPFFLFVYQAIIAAEEAYLQQRFGADYAEYCAQVNRYFPSLDRIPKAFDGLRYNGKRAIKQDLSTIMGIMIGLVLLPFWRTLFIWGRRAAINGLPRTLTLSLGVGVLYAVLHDMKKRGRFAS